MTTTLHTYATEGLLRDGTSIALRAIQPADTARLVAFFQQLSAQSVYFRFFQTKTRLTADMQIDCRSSGNHIPVKMRV